MQTKTPEKKQTSDWKEVQGIEVREKAADLSEISDGNLTKRMPPTRNLENVYTLCMRIQEKASRKVMHCEI